MTFYYSRGDRKRNSPEFQLRNFKAPDEINGLQLKDFRESSPQLYQLGIEFIEKFPNPESPRGLYLWSEISGNGKSTFCVTLCKELMSLGRTQYNCFYFPADYLFEQLRFIYNSGEQLIETPFFKSMIAADIIIIDDVGVEKLTEFVAHRYYYVVNALWAEGRTVLMTSKFNIGDLMKRAQPDVDDVLKDSIASRMRSLMTPAHVGGTDKRAFGKNRSSMLAVDHSKSDK